jgi:hypothetical protein
MKWRLRFLWMKARPLATFCLLVAVPFLPVVPWVIAAGPGPLPIPPAGAPPEILSIADPIPTGAAEDCSLRGPSPPLGAAAIRRASRGWQLLPIDDSGWKLLMTNRFAVRGDIRSDDLRAVGAFAERFLDAVHERLKADLADVRLSIRVFADDSEFQHWASCREIESESWFYDRRSGEISILYGPATDVSDFCGRLMRGVTLEYLDRVFEYSGPSRASDDVAEWFADYEVVEGRVAPRRKRGEVRDLLRNGDTETAWKAWKESSP